jgi:hypothetical protein
MKWDALHIRTKTFLVVAPTRAAILGWAYYSALSGDYGWLAFGWYLVPELVFAVGGHDWPWMWLVVAVLLPTLSYIVAVLLAPWFDKSLE